MRNKTTILAMILIGWAALALAQTTNLPPVNPVDDEAVKGFIDGFPWLKLLIVPVTIVLVMALKKMVGAIPVQIWPWVTPFLGTLIDYLASKTGIWTGSVEAGTLMGGLAVWLHQLITQTKSIATEGPKPSNPPSTSP